MSQNAFDRYAHFIQEYIYRKNWVDLREVQIDACQAIMDTDHHLIVASGTSSGKTEAVFFPILSLLHGRPAQSINVLYIGPLKALINDQFQRLDELLEESGIPVWPWHGDIPQSVKRRALKSAEGILQITPESLESLLMWRPSDVARLFSDLQFVIIDEIHALMGTERGLQVMCQLSRLEKIAECTPRRIGLSATLKDYKPAIKLLSSGTHRETQAIGIKTLKRTVSLAVTSYDLPEEPEKVEKVMEDYNHFIYEHCYDSKCLIFANSRAKVEQTISDLKNLAERKGDPDVFYAHHGSISAPLRHEVERALREHDGPTVAAATLTLELGIDIGDLDLIIQLGAPFSCSSFVQRLGRSGRRTGKSRMLFVHLNELNDNDLFDSLPWELLRTIAIIQLYIEERWVEPFELKPKPFSLLAHQTLSTLVSFGELSPPELARRILLLPPFHNRVNQDEYQLLLRHMIVHDYLETMESGGLIVGLKGEALTNHYSFFAVFQDTRGYDVYSKQGKVGSLDRCPLEGEIFVLAGQSWKVDSIDEHTKAIYVSRAKTRRVVDWQGVGGHIHTKIIKKMRQVLEEELAYPYLGPDALKQLDHARQTVRDNNMLNGSVFSHQDGSFTLCPWVGTKDLFSIAALLRNGLRDELHIRDVGGGRHYLNIRTDLSCKEFLEKLKTINVDSQNPDFILPKERTPRIDKYDNLVPNDLLRIAYLENEMNVAGALEILQQLNG